MAAIGGNAPVLTDSGVDALAWEFLNSDYVGDVYATWSLDQRLSTFLLRSGLVRVANDGDLYNIVLDRVMTGKSSLAGTADRSPTGPRSVGR